MGAPDWRPHPDDWDDDDEDRAQAIADDPNSDVDEAYREELRKAIAYRNRPVKLPGETYGETVHGEPAPPDAPDAWNPDPTKWGEAETAKARDIYSDPETEVEWQRVKAIGDALDWIDNPERKAAGQPWTPYYKPRRRPATPAAGAATPQLTEANGYGADVPGNIDLHNRPDVKNADGSHSSVLSASFEIDGKEVLLPLVSHDGRIWSEDEAIDNYKKTGEHLGIFKNPEAATAAGRRIHEDQAAMMARPPPPATFDTIGPRAAPPSPWEAFIQGATGPFNAGAEMQGVGAELADTRVGRALATAPIAKTLKAAGGPLFDQVRMLLVPGATTTVGAVQTLRVFGKLKTRVS